MNSNGFGPPTPDPLSEPGGGIASGGPLRSGGRGFAPRSGQEVSRLFSPPGTLRNVRQCQGKKVLSRLSYHLERRRSRHSPSDPSQSRVREVAIVGKSLIV